MNGNARAPAVVLMAGNDLDDVALVKKALRECGCDVELHCVRDGEEALEYLTGGGRYENRDQWPRPVLVLLDLDMPKKGGMETLREIRSNPDIRAIPVVVLTTSRDRDLMLDIYRLRGSAFITKPSVYEDMIKAMERLCPYRFGTISPPRSNPPGAANNEERAHGSDRQRSEV